MKASTKWTLRIIFYPAFVAFMVYSFSMLCFPISWEHDAQQARKRRIQLLCQTDHQALLKAGREILSRVPKSYDIAPLPEGIDIPDPIRRLRPRGIAVRREGKTTCLVLEMQGGRPRFGVNVYADDVNEPSPEYPYGDRELLPGLWYYDDGYLNDPGYDKAVDALIEEHKGKDPM